MNKRIFYLSLEIVLLIIFIILSYIWWEIFNQDKSAQIADYYNNKLTINTQQTKNKNINLTINNKSKLKKEYNLYLKYDNNNNIDKNNLKISLNNKTYNLTKLENFTKGNFTYYLINTYMIKSNTQNNYDIHIYPNENLNINFNIEEL